MKSICLILLWCMTVVVLAQPYKYEPEKKIKIYNAVELIKLGKSKGMNELREKVDPIELVYLNNSFASSLIDIEFKTGFWDKLYSNNRICTYDTPDFTMRLVEEYDDQKAARKLFEYYCTLPKYIKSDTIYYIYNNLDNYLKLMVRFKSPKLIDRLRKDYFEWRKLAKKAPRKKYPTLKERKNLSFEESMKFKPSDLYVDCNYITLQIACALNHLNVKGFDNDLIEKLKAKQTNPYIYDYAFPKNSHFGANINAYPAKTIRNKTAITNFRSDVSKIEQLLRDNYGFCCNSKIDEIIENGADAYISVLRNNGDDTYLIHLNKNITIRALVSSDFIE